MVLFRGWRLLFLILLLSFLYTNSLSLTLLFSLTTYIFSADSFFWYFSLATNNFSFFVTLFLWCFLSLSFLFFSLSFPLLLFVFLSFCFSLTSFIFIFLSSSYYSSILINPLSNFLCISYSSFIPFSFPFLRFLTPSFSICLSL
jgi:hypothetical protein